MEPKLLEYKPKIFTVPETWGTGKTLDVKFLDEKLKKALGLPEHYVHMAFGTGKSRYAAELFKGIGEKMKYQATTIVHMKIKKEPEISSETLSHNKLCNLGLEDWINRSV